MVEGNLGHVEKALIQGHFSVDSSLYRNICSHDKNTQLVETKLAGFVEEIIAPPGLVNILVNGEVNDVYAKSLEILSKKLKFVQTDPLINASKALKDVKTELERLRQRALSKVSCHIIEIFFAMRKPGTNIQILQQNLLQKHRYLILFLKEHGSDKYANVCASYVYTMNKEIDRPGLVPHISQVNSLTYPYEVIFRSLQKLLMDTASSEYLFVKEFFGEVPLFYQVFEGPFSVIDQHLDLTIPTCHDAVCLMLLICITRKHELVMSNRRLPCLDAYFDKALIYLWPRFKIVFDMYLQILYRCDVKMLWIDGTHPHHIVRCYVEFTASLVQLNDECGDGQVCSKDSFFVTDDLLMEHFGDLLQFVRRRVSEDLILYTECPNIADVEPIVKNFAMKWRSALELMHNEIVTSCSNLLSGMAILKAALAQLLNDYNRLSECVKEIPGGAALNRNLVYIASISYEIRKYSRTI
ncbi:hypothetical protein PR202_ga00594 [Eleusine coracana subsp. coracana]|uniref:Uncharacterized protein n=1 Tax=Eleusine coracana subsp. coracana TaxID=191504 RepID=A0AAV5BHG1_ELECO|nr:hypothetical protein PR202_ga00594 [Eleusine coracana subsp. coracana]